MEVEIYADLIKVRRQAAPPGQERIAKPLSKRGVISSFSRKSRKRMIEQLAMLRRVENGFFVTPTYPDDVQHTGDKAKRDLDALTKRLQRRFPSCGGIWRIEIKPRQSGAFIGQLAPHFHIMLFGVPMHEVLFRRWFQRAWSQIVYETDAPPRLVRTRADAIKSRKHAARYCSKYAAKAEEIPDDEKIYEIHNWGRRWGVFGALDFACQMQLTISGAQLVKLRRQAARWLHGRGSRFEARLARGSPYNGFAVLGLGDLSMSKSGLFDSTIMRMIFAL